MRARCTDFVRDEKHYYATVVLTPSWWDRIWGERTVAIDMVCMDYKRYDAPGWRTVGTGRKLDDLDHKHIIRDALDQREVGEVRRPMVGGTEPV